MRIFPRLAEFRFFLHLKLLIDVKVVKKFGSEGFLLLCRSLPMATKARFLACSDSPGTLLASVLLSSNVAIILRSDRLFQQKVLFAENFTTTENAVCTTGKV